jgi:hypothetical protein
VSTTTTGDDFDLDGFVVRVAGELERADASGTVEFRTLSAGTHTVQLDDVADNCSVDGGDTRQVTLAPGATTVAFSVTCVALPPATVDVTGTWIGGYDPDGQGMAGRILTYMLVQNGDEVTGLIGYGSPGEYSGVGRVSGSTLSLFYLGLEHESGRYRVTATLEVSGNDMSGNDTEQLGLWAAVVALTRQ